VAVAPDEMAAGPDLRRLTTWIERCDMSQTLAPLYRRQADQWIDPPDAAWTTVPP
jgi:hypothetical protein